MSVISAIISSKVPADLKNSYTTLETDQQLYDICTSQQVFSEIKNNDNIRVAIEEMADIITHELVHILQHISQTDKGRPTLDYRSYLSGKRPDPKSKGDEFQQLHNSGQSNTARWRKLYYASPQEMSAFVHNIVLTLIRSLHLDTAPALSPSGQPIPPPSLNAAAAKLPGLIQAYITPTNPKETAVYKRYIKLAYQELANFYADLENQPKDKSVRVPKPIALTPSVISSIMPPPLPGSRDPSMPPPLPRN